MRFTPVICSARLPVHRSTLTFSAIPEGINLRSLDVLKELELSTLVVRVLPSVLRSIKSKALQSIRFFVLVHQLEDGVDHFTRQLWTQLDFELCALANRVQAANGYGSEELKVEFVDSYSTTPVWMVEEVVRMNLPRSKEHRYISSSFSAG